MAVAGIGAGIVGTVGLWLVAAKAGAAGVGTGGNVRGVVAPVVMSGMWARAELPGDTPIAAAAVIAVRTPAVWV